MWSALSLSARRVRVGTQTRNPDHPTSLKLRTYFALRASKVQRASGLKLRNKQRTAKCISRMIKGP